MNQQHTQQIPSREELEAFMLHWHSQMCAVTGSSAHFTVNVRSSSIGPKIEYGGYSPDHTTVVLTDNTTPDGAIAAMKCKLGPNTLKARAAALREEADKLERGIS
jgi:hypothetical protein